MKRKQYCAILFCCLNVIFACSKENDERAWEGLENREIVLNEYINDTTIRINNEVYFGITGITEIVGDKIIKHDFDYKLGIIKGDWFGIVQLNNSINIRTIENSSRNERYLKIYLVIGGQSDYINIIQKTIK